MERESRPRFAARAALNLLASAEQSRGDIAIALLEGSACDSLFEKGQVARTDDAHH